MTSPVRRLWPQPLVAILASGFALALAYAEYRLNLKLVDFPAAPTGLVLGPFLVLACVASYRYPVHIRHNVKLYMATIPLYILAVCLPPIPAAATAALGIVLGEISVRSQTGCFTSDVMTAGARDFVVVLLVSTTIHLDWVASYPARVAAAVILYWIVEGITLPLIVSPINGESPLRVTLAFVRETWGRPRGRSTP